MPLMGLKPATIVILLDDLATEPLYNGITVWNPKQ